MAPALPFPIHKHPPTVVGPLGALNSIPGLPADQGDSAAIEETAAGEEALESTEGVVADSEGTTTEGPPGNSGEGADSSPVEPAPTVNPTDDGPT